MNKIIVSSLVFVAAVVSSFSFILFKMDSVSVSAADRKNTQLATPIELYNGIEKNAQGIHHYKRTVIEKNQKLKEQKVKDIISTITFTKPMSFEELQTYIEKHKIIPKQLQARALNGSERITIAFKPEAGAKGIENVIRQLETRNAKFVGFTDMYGIVESEHLEGLEHDSRSFLVDTSADDFFTGSDREFAHALTWLLEDVSKKEKVEGYQQ